MSLQPLGQLRPQLERALGRVLRAGALRNLRGVGVRAAHVHRSASSRRPAASSVRSRLFSGPIVAPRRASRDADLPSPPPRVRYAHAAEDRRRDAPAGADGGRRVGGERRPHLPRHERPVGEPPGGAGGDAGGLPGGPGPRVALLLGEAAPGDERPPEPGPPGAGRGRVAHGRALPARDAERRRPAPPRGQPAAGRDARQPVPRRAAPSATARPSPTSRCTSRATCRACELCAASGRPGAAAAGRSSGSARCSTPGTCAASTTS